MDVNSFRSQYFIVPVFMTWTHLNVTAWNLLISNCVLIWKALLLLLPICTWPTNLSRAGLLTGDEAHTNTHLHLLFSFRIFRLSKCHICCDHDNCHVSTFRWRQKLCLPNCFRDLSSVWFLDSLSTLKTLELYGPRVEWSATLNHAHRTCLSHLSFDNSCVLVSSFILYYSNTNLSTKVVTGYDIPSALLIDSVLYYFIILHYGHVKSLV